MSGYCTMTFWCTGTQVNVIVHEGDSYKKSFSITFDCWELQVVENVISFTPFSAALRRKWVTQFALGCTANHSAVPGICRTHCWFVKGMRYHVYRLFCWGLAHDGSHSHQQVPLLFTSSVWAAPICCSWASRIEISLTWKRRETKVKTHFETLTATHNHLELHLEFRHILKKELTLWTHCFHVLTVRDYQHRNKSSTQPYPCPSFCPTVPIAY